MQQQTCSQCWHNMNEKFTFNNMSTSRISMGSRKVISVHHDKFAADVNIIWTRDLPLTTCLPAESVWDRGRWKVRNPQQICSRCRGTSWRVSGRSSRTRRAMWRLGCSSSVRATPPRSPPGPSSTCPGSSAPPCTAGNWTWIGRK